MEENNKIIAEFMGARIELIDKNYHSYDWHGKKYSITPITWNDNSEKTLARLYEITLNSEFGRLGQFHKDWNWLMEVVEKIFKDFYKLNPCPIYLKINIENALNKVDIESVYNACVEFINFYNKQKEE